MKQSVTFIPTLPKVIIIKFAPEPFYIRSAQANAAVNKPSEPSEPPERKY